MQEIGVALPFSKIDWRELRAPGSPWIRIARGLWFKSRNVGKPWQIREYIHWERVKHVLNISGEGSILDGLTAALAWGLPVEPTTNIEILTGIHTSRRTSIYSGYGTEDVKVVRSSRTLPREAFTTVKGLRVLALEYLCVELLARFPARVSIPIVDAAVRRMIDPQLVYRQVCEREFATVRERLFGILARRKDRRGCRRAAWALNFVSIWAESPGESLLRLAVFNAGLPTPVEQLEIVANGRRYYADLGFPAYGVIFEFDGRIKYAGSNTADVVYREKLREDAIREFYPHVRRFVWGDFTGGAVKSRLEEVKHRFFDARAG